MSLSKNKNHENKELNVGDIVMLLNERKNRETWPVARISRAFKSKDGVVRSVECKLPLKVETKKIASQHSTKKKSASKNASKPSDNKGVLVQSSARFTTRGVENIAILEAVTQQSNRQQHVEDTDTSELDTLNLDG